MGRRSLRMRSMGKLALVGAAATLAGGVFVVGCISDEDKGPEVNACPTSDNFPIVSQLLERRCGTLDCHGDGNRSFRVYGQYGLRLPKDNPPAGYVPGGLVGTTADERSANYHSACALEPEEMAAVVAKEEDPDTLTLVRKPRLQEAHKGGRVLPKDGAGDKCLTSWLLGTVDTGQCDLELMKP